MLRRPVQSTVASVLDHSSVRPLQSSAAPVLHRSNIQMSGTRRCRRGSRLTMLGCSGALGRLAILALGRPGARHLDSGAQSLRRTTTPALWLASPCYSGARSVQPFPSSALWRSRYPGSANPPLWRSAAPPLSALQRESTLALVRFGPWPIERLARPALFLLGYSDAPLL